MSSWSLNVSAQVGNLDLAATLSGGPRPMALIGPNGSGKTSLLRAIVGALPCKSERLLIGDRLIADSSAGHSTPIESRGIGYLPQDCGLFAHLTVLDNVAFGLRCREVRRSEARARAAEMLRSVEADHLAARYPSLLSGGERQKVGLARCLILEPSLLLLDEPLAALDACARRRSRAMLSKLLQTRQTPVILVTHDHRDVTALGAEVAVLQAGQTLQQGELSELCAAPASNFVREFTDGLSATAKSSE